MGELRFSGLSTGIDTAQIVAQLMDVNRRRLRMMQNDLGKYENRHDAVSELSTKLTSLRSSAKTLADSSQLRSFNAVTSDADYITADANSNATEGSHSVQIKQLATSDRWVHDGFKYATSLVGTGTLILGYDFKEISITTTADTTLEDLVGLINNDSDNPGINASLLKYNNGSGGIYHLVLSGRDIGSDYQISVNTANTELHTADTALLDTLGENAIETTKLIELSTFGGTMGSGSTSDRIHVTGAQHDATAVDYYFDVTQYTTLEDVLGEIDDAFSDTAKATFENGKIIVTDATSGASSMSIALSFVPGTGSSASLTLPTLSQTTQGGSTAASLSGFDGAAFTEVQSARDSKIRVDGYPANQATAEVQLLTSSVNATSGTYTLSFGGETTAALNYNDSVATVQSALNALSTVSALGGVTVGGTPPSDSGSQMSVTFLATAGDVSQVTISSSMSPGTHAMSTQTQGRDGWINRSTNTVDDVISGVTLRLHDTTDDGAGGYNSIEVNLTRDTEALKTKLNTMIEAYNAAVMFIKEKTKYDAKTNTSGILANDYSVSTIWSQIKDPFSGLLAGFNAGDNDFTSPDDIGLSLDADGLLELDSTTFDEAIVDNYLGVLSLIGAMKTGSSDSYDIKFYGAGANTTAGQYDVKVTGDGSSITSAQIRLAGDTAWRDASFSGSLISGNSTLDSNGNPVYPEHSLQISVDVSKTVPGGTTTNVYVKQGFAGATKDMLDALLNTTKGRVPISINGLDTQIDNTNDRIAQEEDRLEKVEQRLTERFARLERTLSIIQQQMGALGMVQ